MSAIAWSSEQLAIFDWFKTPTEQRNLIVQARAGTGKTTTIREAFSFAPEQQTVNNVLYTVFNKKNQLEAEEKMKHLKVQVKTLHGLGFAYVKRVWCSAVPDDDVEFDRARFALQSDCKESIIAIVKLMGFCKNLCVGIPTMEVLREIAEDKDLVADSRLKLNSLCAVTREALVRSLERDGASRISFNDMVWLPTALDCVKPWFNLVVIDEAQDMSRPQLMMARGACHSGGRIVCIGDDRQAIYGFRGAAQNGMSMMKVTLRAETLPLTVTRRCPKKVVELARKSVEDYRAADDAPEGKVESVAHTQASAVGDVILSRLNAPLMPLALSFLRKHIPARIEGRDIGRQLSTMVKQMRAKDATDFCVKVESWKQKQIARLSVQNQPEKKIENVKDLAETLLCLAEGCVTVYDIETRIGNLFDDTNSKSKPAVTLSTVHKAKGLEWNRVFVLADTFGKNKWADAREEANIWYVAITRTKSELYLVSSQEVTEKVDQKQSEMTLEASKEPTAALSQTDSQNAPESIQRTPRASVVRVDNFDLVPGCVRLQPGDVIEHDGAEHVCIASNQSCARIQCLSGGKTVRASLRKRNGDRTEVEFKSKPAVVSVSNQMEPKSIVRRLTESELKDFLAGNRSPAKNQHQSEQNESDDMSKKTKTKKTGAKREGKMAWILALLSGTPGVTKSKAAEMYMKKFPNTPEKTARATVSWCCSSPKGLKAHKLKPTWVEEPKAESKPKAVKPAKKAAKKKPAKAAKKKMPARAPKVEVVPKSEETPSSDATSSSGEAAA
jgi:hypothetical protein